MEKKIIHSDNADFKQRVKELLMYRRIVKAEQVGDQNAILMLDNGVVLDIQGNEGCYGCGNGWYYITSLAKCENAITNVVCDTHWDEVEEVDVYNIFVFADNQQINLLQVEGSDNGYYGTGYWLTVTMPDVGA